MTQSSLFELARNGNPQAIASLMNQVLEPKGVVAKTQLEGNCLHILFTSDHSLSQTAIASFVQNGLNALGTKSFQTVKLYAKKLGQETPLWVDTFSLKSYAEVTQPPTSRAVSPTASLLPPPASVATGSTLPTVEKPRAAVAKPQARRPAQQSKKQSTANFNQWRHNWLERLNQYKVAIAVSAGAFVIGGTAALMFNPQAQSTSQAPAANSTNSLTPNLAVTTPALTNQAVVQPGEAQKIAPASSSEAEAEAYLTKMNKAQEAFYQTNGRFAATLEELERSASIMSQSANYTYRLVLRDPSQSVLTATPKQANFRSYSGTVVVANSSDANTMAGVVCKTSQPSNFPPILPQLTGQPIQCPADAIQVTN